MTIHIKIEDVQRIKTQLARAVQEAEQAAKRVQDTANHADWHDQNRQEFDQKLKACLVHIAQFQREAGELSSSLTRVITQAKQLAGR